MKIKTTFKFNIPVGGEEASLTMAEIMLLAKRHQAAGEYEAARIYLERAVFASYAPAKLHLARLLRDTESLAQTQSKRLLRCEQLLLELERTTEKREALAPICYELSLLYEKMRRPISCLGYLLRARRYGHEIEEKIVADCKKKICQQLDINKLSADARGCYVLGVECSKDHATMQHGVYFLEEAVQNADPNGVAALELADVLNYACQNDAQSQRLAKKYYAIAKKRGNPDVLAK